MVSPIPHFDLPLNLPHAGTLSGRIVYFLGPLPADSPAHALARELSEMLRPYQLSEENPADEEAKGVVAVAAQLGRDIVGAVERSGKGHDRLGQAIRNLFECLQFGEEGALISLRAGENPDSALRPK